VLYLDASALLAVNLVGGSRPLLLDAMTADPVWCSSALSLTEAVGAIDRLTDEAVLRADLEDAIRLTWDHVAVVPADRRCLDRATELLRERPLRLCDAIHLAAADRLERPAGFVTVDPAQIPVAQALGFTVVSP